MEQKEWATIEDEIALLEERVDALTEAMNQQGMTLRNYSSSKQKLQKQNNC